MQTLVNRSVHPVSIKFAAERTIIARPFAPLTLPSLSLNFLRKLSWPLLIRLIPLLGLPRENEISHRRESVLMTRQIVANNSPIEIYTCGGRWTPSFSFVCFAAVPFRPGEIVRTRKALYAQRGGKKAFAIGKIRVPVFMVVE